MFADRYFARKDKTKMYFYALLFLGICCTIHADPAQSYQYRQSDRLRRFAEIGGERFDPALKMFWHVGIYSKRYSPYMQICGGTLVTQDAVISAAHCFWSDVEGALPADHFAVGAGKQYRPWDDTNDRYTGRTSDVAAIHIPVRYHDSATNYQEDIAVVIVAEKFDINHHAIRPVCVNFGEDFDEEQLSPGNKGVILGWGLAAEDGPPSQVLNYLKLPAVGIKECMTIVDQGFLRYLTSDKICAGVLTGKALCRGDSGGGLVFNDRIRSSSVPYLRGVASTASRNNHSCNAHTLAAFTHVRAHRAFLRRHIPDIEDHCEDYYPFAYLLRERPSSIRYADYDSREPERPLSAERVTSSPCTCEDQPVPTCEPGDDRPVPTDEPGDDQPVPTGEPGDGLETSYQDEGIQRQENSNIKVLKVLY